MTIAFCIGRPGTALKLNPDGAFFWAPKSPRNTLLASYRQAGGGAENLETFLRDLRKKKPLAQQTVRAWGEWLTLAIRNLADLF
jgi:hypothetical protein